jgi:hypothetical protein
VWPASISIQLLNNPSLIPSEMMAYCILSCYDKYMSVTSLTSEDIEVLMGTFNEARHSLVSFEVMLLLFILISFTESMERLS